MGIFDFLKKLGKTEKVEEIVVERLAFSEIENWIKGKIRENEVKERKILVEIEQAIQDFTKEIKEKLTVLEMFDVDSKKEKDNIKGIVKNSRIEYVESVENFLEKLNNLNMNKLEKTMKKINKIFFDFNKSSFKNYERATILIGKEMATIKQGVRDFSKNLLKTYEENKNIVDFFKTILQIQLKHQEISAIDNTLNKIVKEKVPLNKKISDKEEENKVLKQNLEEIKNSQDYLDFLNSQERAESLKLESREHILDLKQFLDFKALANFFHINPEQMKIVQNHKEDFYSYFIKDNGKSILILLDESKLNNDKILEKITNIHSKLEEIKNHEQDIKEDKTLELHPQIKEITIEIDNLKIERAKEEKRHEKLKRNQDELISLLKQELSKMNVEVE